MEDGNIYWTILPFLRHYLKGYSLYVAMIYMQNLAWRGFFPNISNDCLLSLILFGISNSLLA